MKKMHLSSYKKPSRRLDAPGLFNDVGYELADADKQLPLALQYAEKAVHDEEEASTKIELSALKNLHYACAVERRWTTAGESPARELGSLHPEAIGAAVEETKPSEPPV